MGAQHWCLLLLTCSLVKCIPQTSETTEPTIVKHQYIISFHDFLPIEEHNTILETYIGNTDSWELIERHNQATEFPSDFALIRITNPENERRLISSLKLNKNIKNIFPQKRYTRSPSAFIDTDILEYPTSFSQLRNNQTCTVDEPNKRNGRQTGKIFMQDEFSNFGTRKLHSAPQVTQLLNADFFWDKGISGKGIRVAIFDTGLSYEHPHFLNIKDLTDWTDEGTLEDYVGHGTFVAGIIASVDQFCSGFAPDSELYIFRVFTNSQASYTSWFLDAFNYAIHCKIDVLNLSIGGPDWKDEPFVEKVWELSANNVIVVSAIGNDGPLFGTLNNPADMMDVLGVGGIDYNDKIASFSSRGMTTWELPLGYGRVKPDIVGYGRSVSGSRFYEGCRTMSGTSVASPVIAGAVTLLISSVPSEYRNNIVNPASIKQVLVETAELVGEAGIFEQGFGKMNMVAAYEALSLYTPRASVIPPALDFTECPYMWPFCVQPTYHTAMPIIFNTTILNGMGVAGFIDHPHWIAGKGGEYLELAFTYSDILWPWTGFLAIHIQVTEEGANYRGTAEGVIQVVVRSPPRLGEVSERITTIEIPVRVQIIPTPHRSKRILWDQYHSLSYPLGFFPNDILWDNSDPFDWNADHLHTNFRTMFEEIQNLGFFVEILGEPFTCFNADNYKILIIADSEENFAPEEQEKLYEDVSNGLSLVVIADWYNTRVMDKISFFDENTDKIWKPFTGGCNLPALNELLGAYDIQFGNGVYNGEVHVNGHSFRYGSGSAIVQFPQGGKVLLARLNDQASSILASGHKMEEVGILGFYSTSNNITPEGGRIAVFGDSSCFDDAMDGPSCRWLLRDLLFYSSALAEPHIDKNTITVTSTNIPDSAIIPERLSDQTESFTRLPEGEILCQSPYFQEPTNFQEDPVEILWQPLMYIQKENPMDALPQPAVTQILQDNIEDYLVPYLVICGCVILIMAFAIRRKTKTTNQKHPAIPSDSNKALV